MRLFPSLFPAILCAAGLGASTAAAAGHDPAGFALAAPGDRALARALARRLAVSRDPDAEIERFLRVHGDRIPATERARDAWFRSGARALPATRRAAANLAWKTATDGSNGASDSEEASANEAAGCAFSSDPHGAAAEPAGVRLSGFAGWRASPRLMDMLREAGDEGGVYRRTVFINQPADYRYIGEDFREAERIGMRTWLTCVGTPAALSPFPDEVDSEFDTGLPEYARFAPTDAVAWADRVLAYVQAMENRYGVVPDFIEIWNEPDRAEWYSGTASDYLALYAAAAQRLRSVRPEIRVGGPGLAGSRSALDGAEGLLFALVRHVASSGAPLDFVSWHNYAPANELLLTRVDSRLDALGSALGAPAFDAVVSEWNIHPSAQGEFGPEFDGSHGAANYAGFVTTAAELGIDANMFFLDRDEDDEAGVSDLAGLGMGAITQHGIKKPVMRLHEILMELARLPSIPVSSPTDEFNVRVFAARRGSEVRYVISNDCVSSDWLVAQRARQHGMDPGWLLPRLRAAGDSSASVESLLAQGLDAEQAQAALALLAEAKEAARHEREPRTVTLRMSGDGAFSVARVLRFDAIHNAPARHRAAILGHLEAAAAHARSSAAAAGAAFLADAGYDVDPQALLSVRGDFFAWAETQAVAYGHAVACWKLLRDCHRDEELAGAAFLNSLPETALAFESPAEAQVSVQGREVLLTVAPNGVVVLDVRL